MIRLVLVRHGQSEADLEPRRIEGSADFSLTALGQQQARLLAQRISREYRIDSIVSSPLRRAVMTAQAIAEATGVSVEFDARLCERSSGLLAGMTKQEADEKFPLPPHGRRVHEAPPEGESYLQHFARVAEFWFSLYYSREPRTIVVVTHGGTLQCLYHAALGLPPTTHVAIAFADTCVHEWEIAESGKVVIRLANCTRHLAGLSASM